MTENGIRGILTNCSTGEKIELDFDYEIEVVNNFLESGAKYFRLIVRLFPPPEDLIGFIGFSVDNSDLNMIRQKGWIACSCNEIEDTRITKITKTFKLFFQPEEMKRAI